MTRRDLAALAALLLLGFGLRFADLAHPPHRWLDENANLPAAAHYWEDGQFEPDTWEHPPLRNLLTFAFLRALGDGPIGWRLRNVLFGTAAALLTWLLALHVTGSRSAALLAGALVATDPLHVVLSRFTFEEIYGGAFFLAAVVALALRPGRSGWQVLSALLLGCALGTKWYYVPGWLLLAALAVHAGRPGRDPRAWLFLACCWLLVPLGVYLAAYAPWYGRGYGLLELAEFTRNAYLSLQSLDDAAYRIVDRRTVFLGARTAADWFTTHLMAGEGTVVRPGVGEFIVYGNSLPSWGLTLPAVAVVALAAWRRRSLALVLPPLFFLGGWALFLPVRRPVLLYSAAPLLPFAFAAVAAALWLAAERLGPRRHGHRLFWLAAALLVGWNLYLYPLVTAKQVPLRLYQPLLERSDVRLH